MISKITQPKEHTIVITNPTVSNDESTKGSGNLKKYFGKSKEGLDGLSFQKKVRSEWK